MKIQVLNEEGKLTYHILNADVSFIKSKFGSISLGVGFK